MGRAPDFYNRLHDNRLHDVKDQKDFSRPRGKGMKIALYAIGGSLAIAAVCMFAPVKSLLPTTDTGSNATPAGTMTATKVSDLTITTTPMKDGSFQGGIYQGPLKTDNKNLLGTYVCSKDGTMKLTIDGVTHTLGKDGAYKGSAGGFSFFTTDKGDIIGVADKTRTVVDRRRSSPSPQP